MDWIKGMQRCINYIEDHITEPMELADIAHEMNVSPFYFQRIFTLVCGLTPGEYIRSRRQRADFNRCEGYRNCIKIRI